MGQPASVAYDMYYIIGQKKMFYLLGAFTLLVLKYKKYFFVLFLH